MPSGHLIYERTNPAGPKSDGPAPLSAFALSRHHNRFCVLFAVLCSQEKKGERKKRGKGREKERRTITINVKQTILPAATTAAAAAVVVVVRRGHHAVAS